MKFAENKIGFTINIFDDSDNILPIIQVRGEYVTQMHNTVRIVQLGAVKDDVITSCLDDSFVTVISFPHVVARSEHTS